MDNGVMWSMRSRGYDDVRKRPLALERLSLSLLQGKFYKNDKQEVTGSRAGSLRMEASADSLSSTLLLIEPVSSNASLLDLDNASHIGGPSLGYGYAQGFAPLPGSSPAPVDPPWGTWFPGPDSPYSAGQAVVIALVLLCVVVVTFVGNILVCVAVCLVRKLRRPCNYLLVSLAVSDICVAVLVMPMALLYEVFGRWDFGRVMCDLWVSFDVLSCTASILNLCMISVDRRAVE
ncbi:hypothetical protein FOCC_FOCC009376 [Frankliniella occidentalis]|nr:hypothetical protein FOCC_FOCC009376 [Frankliniella occidentalis]